MSAPIITVMSESSPIHDRVRAFASGRPALVGLACGGLVLFITYLAVFQTTRSGQAFWLNLTSAIFNAGTATVIGAAVISITRLQLIGRPAAIQAVGHGGLAIAFSYVWYLTVIILNGIRGGSLVEGFDVNPFNSVALTWQLFQGVAIYAVIAMGAYVLHYRQALAALRRKAAAPPEPAQTAPEPGAGRRVMVRGTDGLIALDFDELLYVRAAGDGASLVTRSGVHETRKTLTALTQLLPEGRFIRAHRSVLVNREVILSAEPAGDGRLTLHLPAGRSVTTSRAGARAVREAALL